MRSSFTKKMDIYIHMYVATYNSLRLIVVSVAIVSLKPAGKRTRMLVWGALNHKAKA